MPTFELTSPQGQTYRVEGPEGATEQDALRQLQRQLAGLPIEQPAMSAGDQGADVAKSAGLGVVKGAIGLAGAPADTLALNKQIGGYLGEKMGLSPETQSKVGTAADYAARIGLMGPLGSLGMMTPGAGKIRSGVESVTGPLYDPKTKAGEYAQTVGEFAPAALTGPGGFARKVATQAIIPGIASQAAGDLPGIKGTKYEPWVRGAAAVASPVAATKAISPFASAASASRRNAVNLLRQEGVTDITAGQAVGSKRLRYAESELGGSTAERMAERQGEQFTSAALRRIGETAAERATPEVIDRSFIRIGGQMNRLAAQNPLVIDRRVVSDISAARNEYNGLIAEPMRAPMLQNVVERIINSVGPNGVIPGRTYQAIRSDIGRYARAARADPNLQHALYEIQGALDANMERALTRSNPGAVGAWRDARRQYRNLLVIERAANYAGEAAASGIISPANLARATKAIQNSRNYARGRGDFTPLARAGVEVLSQLPNSGTAQRLRAHGIPAMVAAALGGTAGSAAGPHGTIGGIAAGLAAPRAAGEAILSRPGRAYLGNQLLPSDPHPYRSAAARGVMSQTADEDRRRKALRITVPVPAYGGPQ